MPSVTELHQRVVQVASRLHAHYGVEIPEMNGIPVLSRYVHELLLPPTVYVGAKGLLSLLRIDMHLRSVSTLTPNTKVRARLARSGASLEHLHSSLAFSRNAAVPRCVMLMAAVVVMLKLRYGLDGEPRTEVPDTAVAGAPPLDAWLDAVCRVHGRPVDDGAPGPAVFAPWDTSVYVLAGVDLHSDLLGLDDGQVDTYLAFLEQQYMPSNVPASQPLRQRVGMEDLLAFAEAPAWPTAPPPVAAARAVDDAQCVRRRTAAQELYTASEAPAASAAPGEAYAVPMYDPAGAVPRELQRVLDVAARVVGLDTAPAPAFRGPHLLQRTPRDQTVLSDCVMQLEEALVLTLRRRATSHERYP